MRHSEILDNNIDFRKYLSAAIFNDKCFKQYDAKYCSIQIKIYVNLDVLNIDINGTFLFKYNVKLIKDKLSIGSNK